MKELNDGRVPREIHEQTKGKDISVGLSDKRKERYRPPTPPAYVAYSGQGVSMGGTASAGGTVNKESTDGKPVVDESKETTNINIRFHNGDR